MKWRSLLSSSTMVVKFLESSKNNFNSEERALRTKIYPGNFYPILLRLDFKLFLQCCISSEFYVNPLTSDPEMKHGPVFFLILNVYIRKLFSFSAVFSFILCLVLIERSFTQTSEIKIAIPVLNSTKKAIFKYPETGKYDPSVLLLLKPGVKIARK